MAADANGNPIDFEITGGEVHDAKAADKIIEKIGEAENFIADKGYDSNAIRRQVEGRGAIPNIPPKAYRKWKNCFSPFLYRARNAIERMFCRFKDWRRVATRFDRNVKNFMATIAIAATVIWWLK